MPQPLHRGLALKGSYLCWMGLSSCTMAVRQLHYMLMTMHTCLLIHLTDQGAGVLIYERVYAIQEGKPQVHIGSTSKQPTVDVAPEVFVLRKLLPQTADYDFNIHIMDFRPGEYLYVKEIHYNQHGLLLLQGQGIYRLANNWYPVQAGDAIWMAPYVIQWYAALGNQNSRYILYKDTTLDPLIAS
ncbi:hypothetical protein ABBQ32_008472 [Trebouxia sp. C0010 RCD-2024]